MVELDLLFDKPKSVTSELETKKAQKVKGESDMGKLFQNIIGFGVVLAVFAMGLDWYNRAGADNGAVFFGNTTEEVTLGQIKKYCFPSQVPFFGGEKDEATCKIWLQQYRSLEKYEYSDSANQKTVETQETAQGNAESPAN